MGWTIRRAGTDYEVVDGAETRESVLLADGLEVDRQVAGYWESSRLTHGDIEIHVRWGPRNTVTACEVQDAERRTPLVPPAGSPAARHEAFAREHPVQLVLRRVAVAGAEIAIGVLGISALVAVFLGSLVPRLDLPSIDLPSIDLSWLRLLDIGHWLGRLGLGWPDIDVPGWVETVMEHRRYWLPLVIALFVALGEIERRRKRDADREADTDDDTPGT